MKKIYLQNINNLLYLHKKKSLLGLSKEENIDQFIRTSINIEYSNLQSGVLTSYLNNLSDNNLIQVIKRNSHLNNYTNPEQLKLILQNSREQDSNFYNFISKNLSYSEANNIQNIMNLNSSLSDSDHSLFIVCGNLRFDINKILSNNTSKNYLDYYNIYNLKKIEPHKAIITMSKEVLIENVGEQHFTHGHFQNSKISTIFFSKKNFHGYQRTQYITDPAVLFNNEELEIKINENFNDTEYLIDNYLSFDSTVDTSDFTTSI